MASIATHTGHATNKRKRSRSRLFSGGLAGIAARWREVHRKFKWWELTLFVVGILASLSVLGALFFAVGDKPSRIYTDAPVPAVDSREFAIALSNLVAAPMDTGGTVTPLNNGDEFVPALLAAINGAKSTINFSVFVWKDGVFSGQLLSALLKKQQEGVEVRILLDGYGAVGISSKKFEPLIKAGAKVETYRTVRFGQLTRFHRRNHRRSIVIDGELGFTGGIAVSDVWLGHAQDPDHWRDMMFKMTGPLARRLQAAFVDTWVSSCGEILVGRNIYPNPATDSASGVQRFIPLANSPSDDDQAMAYFFLVPILAARHSIFLASPYFIPDVSMKRALEQKAREGVDVRLLLPGAHTDNVIVRASSEGRYDELLNAGVKIYEYQPTFLHAKFGVIDGKWSIVGSPNLNSRSRQLDEEVAFGIMDLPLAGQLQDTFSKELRSAKAIELRDWRRRDPFHRLVETMSRILDQQS